MSTLAPKQKRPAGESCRAPVMHRQVDRDRAKGKAAGEVGFCDLVPLFDLSQPTVRMAQPTGPERENVPAAALGAQLG